MQSSQQVQRSVQRLQRELTKQQSKNSREAAYRPGAADSLVSEDNVWVGQPTSEVGLCQLGGTLPLPLLLHHLHPHHTSASALPGCFAIALTNRSTMC